MTSRYFISQGEPDSGVLPLQQPIAFAEAVADNADAGSQAGTETEAALVAFVIKTRTKTRYGD
jgi:hypothetical protein